MKPAVLLAALAGLALPLGVPAAQAQAAAVVTKQYDDGGVY